VKFLHVPFHFCSIHTFGTTHRSLVRVASPCCHHAFEVMGPQRERGRSPRQSHVFHFAYPAHPCRSLARGCEAHRNARQHTHCTHADKLRPADARPLCSNDAPLRPSHSPPAVHTLLAHLNSQVSVATVLGTSSCCRSGRVAAWEWKGGCRRNTSPFLHSCLLLISARSAADADGVLWQ
jgi:hypothetical protein